MERDFRLRECNFLWHEWENDRDGQLIRWTCFFLLHQYIFNAVFPDAEDYGMKSDLDIADPLALDLGQRKIIGMKKSGDFLVAI